MTFVYVSCVHHLPLVFNYPIFFLCAPALYWLNLYPPSLCILALLPLVSWSDCSGYVSIPSAFLWLLPSLCGSLFLIFCPGLPIKPWDDLCLSLHLGTLPSLTQMTWTDEEWLYLCPVYMTTLQVETNCFCVLISLKFCIYTGMFSKLCLSLQKPKNGSKQLRF